jgi:hypothetical protein
VMATTLEKVLDFKNIIVDIFVNLHCEICMQADTVIPRKKNRITKSGCDLRMTLGLLGLLAIR